MDPLRFVFGVHFHQPVGNFDHVFEQHVRDVYRPLLERLAEREFFPIALHISGPLLEWLEAHEAALLDRIAGLAGDGRLELLLSGFYEPVLASLPREDRVEQIRWMREAVERRFGAKAHGGGLWLTERVWEPELAADLALAGVRYALVDDRHFLVSGFAGDRLHAPFWTESDGKRVALFPIDERLRYLIPFQPAADIAAYLRQLRERGAPLAVFVDDGEKFGGWPGTKEWVYDRGWLAQFLDAMGALVASGEIRLTTPATALAEVPSGGLAYLPTASYREMEGWALPPDAASRLARLERDLGAERLAGPDGALVRGAHWRNFFVRYPESNRMHKKMQALSALCRRPEAYHELALQDAEHATAEASDGAPSIHDIEKRVRLERRPPVDREARAMCVDRILPGDLTLDSYASGDYEPVVSWAAVPLEPQIRTAAGAVEVTCRAPGLEKRLRFEPGGGLTVSYRWDPAAYPADAHFAPESSLAHPLEPRYAPQAEVWSFPVATVSKSERGLEETVQGQSLTPRWPVARAEARIEFSWTR